MTAPLPHSRGKNMWTPQEIEMLKKGVAECGKGNWAAILDKYPKAFSKRDGCDLKDKYRWLLKKEEQQKEAEEKKKEAVEKKKPAEEKKKRTSAPSKAEETEQRAKKKPKAHSASPAKPKAPRKRGPDARRVKKNPVPEVAVEPDTTATDDLDGTPHEPEFELCLITDKPHHIEIFGQRLKEGESLPPAFSSTAADVGTAANAVPSLSVKDEARTIVNGSSEEAPLSEQTPSAPHVESSPAVATAGLQTLESAHPLPNPTAPSTSPASAETIRGKVEEVTEREVVSGVVEAHGREEQEHPQQEKPVECDPPPQLPQLSAPLVGPACLLGPAEGPRAPGAAQQG